MQKSHYNKIKVKKWLKSGKDKVQQDKLKMESDKKNWDKLKETEK